MKIVANAGVFLVLFFGACSASVRNTTILFNQLGFYPAGPKIAVILNAKSDKFLVQEATTKKTVFQGTLSEERISAFADRRTRIADFSALVRQGHYILSIPGITSSAVFQIKENLFDSLGRASIKAFYYQRMSVPLPEKFAGVWTRAGGHPDTQVYIHPSAASPGRKALSSISASGGWYDAGDYNKYIVNSGITMGTILSSFEDFPAYYGKQDLNIPESEDKVPDILNEALFNLRWMFKMQDPYDGGVYNKLTNAEFDRLNEMPTETRKKRYVVQKGTAATLDFAAVMAQASRIFKAFEIELPGLSDSCLHASKAAWNWAKKNPSLEYDQNKMNRTYSPKINTGGYGDRDFSDEFIWAASELSISTGDKSYINSVTMFPDNSTPLPAWSQVRMLGYYSLIRCKGKVDEAVVTKARALTLKLADSLINGYEKQPFNTVMGQAASDFNWGSNSNAANQGVALIQAFRLTHNRRYLKAALGNLDYLLGRNITGYSFITGFGTKSPMHPHHRLSEADGIGMPIPGFLVGGPNPGKQDKCSGYPSSVPDEAYLDASCSYASNEVAINWNAPLVYLVNAIQASELHFNRSTAN